VIINVTLHDGVPLECSAPGNTTIWFRHRCPFFHFAMFVLNFNLPLDLHVGINVSEEYTISSSRLKFWYLPTGPHGFTVWRYNHKYHVLSFLCATNSAGMALIFSVIVNIVDNELHFSTNSKFIT
jgi:hypothetical protein